MYRGAMEENNEIKKSIFHLFHWAIKYKVKIAKSRTEGFIKNSPC